MDLEKYAKCQKVTPISIKDLAATKLLNSYIQERNDSSRIKYPFLGGYIILNKVICIIYNFNFNLFVFTLVYCL